MNTYRLVEQSRDTVALIGVVLRYYVCISFRVRRELRRWRQRASEIRDPHLRETAIGKLDGESLNTEAAAVFATLVPRRDRAALVELIVAFEVMYDYLDAVSEDDAVDALANGRQLHRALVAAIVEPSAPVDFYGFHPRPGDGGYLDDLAATCRRCFASLPAASVVLPVAMNAVERCGQGQSRSHAVRDGGIEQLETWARSLADDSAYRWWELAAGASSSLAMHALFAAAADARTTRGDAMRADRAYFPAVCSLSTLLDSLIDYEADIAAGEHSYVAYYGTSWVAAGRLAFVARDADRAVRALRHPRRHAVIASGVAGFYLSAVEARGPNARAPTDAVIASLSASLIRPVHAITRLKRRH